MKLRLKWIIITLLLVVFLAPALAAFALRHAQQGQTTHVVQPGENLYRIALQYGTTWPVLAAANGIANPNLIYVGQVLIIPGWGHDSAAAACSLSPQPPQPTTPQTYTVVAGDTLSSIALRFGTTVTALVQANGIVNPNLIYVGQVLKIPGGTAPVPGQPPPAADTRPRPADAGSAAADFPATAAVLRMAPLNWAGTSRASPILI